MVIQRFGEQLANKMGFRDSLIVALVTVYLLAVGCFLIITRQIAAAGLFHLLRSLARRPYESSVQTARPERGRCFVADLPSDLLSDQDYASSIVLFEDGKE